MARGTLVKLLNCLFVIELVYELIKRVIWRQWNLIVRLESLPKVTIVWSCGSCSGVRGQGWGRGEVVLTVKESTRLDIALNHSCIPSIHSFDSHCTTKVSLVQYCQYKVVRGRLEYLVQRVSVDTWVPTYAVHNVTSLVWDIRRRILTLCALHWNYEFGL